jgi:sugar phosphate isomerase/epimerase
MDDEGVFDMLGISSSWLAIKGLTIRESVEKIFEMGFELCELGAAHKYEEGVVETVMELRKEYPDKKFSIHAKFPPDKINLPEGRKNNSRSNGHNYTMNLADPKEHEAIMKAIKKMFDISDRINAEIVGIHGGYAGEVKWVEGDLGFEELEMVKPMPLDEAKTNMKIILEELVNTAEERGIKFAVEISPPGSFAPVMVDEESFDWLFSNFSSKYMGMLVDIGHLELAAKAMNYDPYEFVRKFKKKVFQLHLHDCKDGVCHILAGSGNVVFEKYFKILGRAKLRKMPMVFEYNNSVSEEQAVKSKQMIENLLVKKL